MRLIEAVEIKYFRSIYYLKLDKIKELSVLSGRNDHGKSNVLKALNLFFNGETDWQTPLEFYRDFNMRRLAEVRQDTIKGRQYISIKVTFNRGDRFENSLPRQFSVTREWYRDSDRYEQKDDLNSHRRPGSAKPEYAKRFLSQFLSSIKYEYVPAIKDNRVFEHVIAELQKTLYNAGAVAGLDELTSQVSSLMGEHVRELTRDFKHATGVQTEIALPKTLEGFYRVSVNTALQFIPGYSVNLDLRGDGIRTRYIPSILHFIARASKKFYVWGFEEPENSLEHRLATKMADDFVQTYSKLSQVFLTTHAPAFLKSGGNVGLYRVVLVEGQTVVFVVGPELVPQGRVPADLDLLKDDLGLMAIEKEMQTKFEAKLSEFQHLQDTVKSLQEDILAQKVPHVLTEGITDALIIKTAWDKLFPDRACPFVIKSCDVSPNDKGGTGGASILRQYLEVVRYDHPSIVIGLFDYDAEGIHAFNSLSHFDPPNGIVRVHENGKAVALLLPIPTGREAFAQGRSPQLTIEYYFSDDVLLNRSAADGTKLLFEPLEARTVVGQEVVSVTKATEWHHHRIVTGKTVFAREIVPNLPVVEFSHFSVLFSVLESRLGLVSRGDGVEGMLASTPPSITSHTA